MSLPQKLRSFSVEINDISSSRILKFFLLFAFCLVLFFPESVFLMIGCCFCYYDFFDCPAALLELIIDMSTENSRM